MAYTPYTTHEMLSVIEHAPRPSSFWLDLVFTQEFTFDTQFIDFDLISGGRRIAPFVAPTAAGKPMKSEGYTTRRFAPAYVKPLHPLDMGRIIPRRAGEPYTGSMSLMQRRDAIMADIVVQQRDMIQRRWELMAYSAVADGKVTVVGEDYPEVEVDFQRAAGNTVALTGAATWDETTATPLDDLENWAITMARSCGYAPTLVVMGTNAWKAFSKHASVKEILNTNYRNGTASLNMALGSIPGDGAIIQRKGDVGENFQVITYNDIYQNDAGTNIEIMDPNSVILLNPQGVEGIRCYGAIMDAEAGYQPLPVFPKNWANQNPSVEYVMSQSAPLMVPRRTNASFKAVVL